MVTEEIDSGDILLQKEIPLVENETLDTLKVKSCNAAKELVGSLLDRFEKDELKPVRQDASKASYYPPLKPENGEINWTATAKEIENHIRGVRDFIACYSMFGEKRFNIVSGKAVPVDTRGKEPGEVLLKQNNFLLVTTGDPNNALLIEIADEAMLFERFSRIRANRIVHNRINKGDLLSGRNLPAEKTPDFPDRFIKPYSLNRRPVRKSAQQPGRQLGIQHHKNATIRAVADQASVGLF
jgi:methionyl-tRNA formyltransferase